MSIGAAPGGLPPIGAQAVLLGMQQFNQSVRQATTGLGQINSASIALERNSTLASARMTSAIASFSSAVITGSTRAAAGLGLATAGVTGLGIGLVALATSAVLTAASFEKALAPSRVFGELTEKQTAALGDTVQDLSRRWGDTTGVIAEGATALSKAGVSFKDLQGSALEAADAMRIANAGEISVADSADIITQVLRSYKLPASDAMNVTNALTGANLASTASIEGLIRGMGQSLAIAAQVGVSYKDLAVELAILNDENVRGERAGTALRNLWLRMLNPSKDVEGVMVRYGVSLADASGNMVSARTFIERLSEAFSDNALKVRGVTKAQADADIATLGMSRSLLGAIGLANQGTAAFDKYSAAIDKTDAKKIADAFTDNTVKQLEIAVRNISALAEALGEPFNANLREALKNVNAFLRSIDLGQVRAFATGLRDQIGSAIEYVSQLISKGAAAIGGLFTRTGASSLISGSLTGALTAIMAVVNNLRATWDAIWSNPRVQAAVASIFASLERLATGVMPILAKGADAVQLAFVVLSEIIRDLLPKAIDAIPWEQISKRVSDVVTGVLDFLNGGYKQVIQSIYNGAVTVVSGVVSAVTQVVNSVADVVSSVFKFVASLATSFVNSIVNYFTGVVGLVVNTVVGVSDTVSSVFKFIVDTLSSMAADVGRVLEPLLTFFDQELPKSIRPTLEAVAIVAAATIVLTKAFYDMSVNIMRTAGIWNKPLVDSFTKDAPSAFQYFVNVAKSGFNNFLQALDILSRSFQTFGNNFVEILRLNASASADFVKFVADKFRDFIQFLSELPIIGKYVEGLVQDFDSYKTRIEGIFKTIGDAPGAALKSVQDELSKIGTDVGAAFTGTKESVESVINSIGQTASNLGADMQKAFDDARATVSSILPTLSTAGEGVRKFLEQMLENARNSIKIATPEVTDFLAKIQAALAGAGKIGGATVGLPTTTGAGLNLPQVPPEGAGISFPTSQAAETEKYVKSLLSMLPGLNDEVVKYVSELVGADWKRLQPIVDALKAQGPLMRDILNAQKDILATDIKIEEVNRALEALSRQQQSLEIAKKQALLPLEIQTLALHQQDIAIQQQMLPIQRDIAEIDKKIALLQRENLDLKIRALQIQLQMLPIQNAIADIDKRIADTQRVNYDLAIRDAQLRLQELPIQNAIADLQKRIADNNKENFELTRQRLTLQQQELPIQNAIAAIQDQINQAQQTNFDLEGRILQAQLAILPYKQAEVDIQAQIQALGQANYALELDKARAAQTELPIKQKIADIEQQINDIVDKRQVLLSKREQLVAEQNASNIQKNLDAVDKQLNDLWAKFGSGRGAGASALVPQILGLEAQKKQLEDALKPANDLVDTLKKQQEEQDRVNEITKIGLQLQEQDQIDILDPIEKHIKALDDQAAAQKAADDIVRIGLEQQKAALDALLVPLEKNLQDLEQEKQLAQLIRDIQINSLEQQKQLYEQMLLPIEQQLKLIDQTVAASKIATDLINSYLQEQIQNQQIILDQYENERIAIQREQQAYNIRNEIVRLGLEQQKQRLEDILRDWQNQLDIVNREKAAEDLRNQIAIAGLEQQKRKLQDLLQPLQDIKDKIDFQTAALALQQAAVAANYDMQILKLQELVLKNEAYKLALEGIKANEQNRLADLISKFQDAITKSGAFTSAEAAELVKRLGYWDQEKDKLADLTAKYNDVVLAITKTGGMVDATNKLSPAITGAGGANSSVDTLKTALAAMALQITKTDGTVDAVSKLSGAVGANSTVGTNLVSTKNAANDMKDAMVNLNTAIYNVITQLVGTSNNGLEQHLGSTRDWLNAAKDAAGGLSDKFGSFSDQTTLLWKIWQGAIYFQSLGDQIKYAGQQMSSFSDATTKSIATEAVATGAATASMQYYVTHGFNYNDAAKSTYDYVKNLITSHIIGYAQGGTVPGPIGQPQMAIVHGGEYVMTPQEQREPTGAWARSIVTYNQQHTEINYNFSASYERQQDPITASQDMRSIIEMTR